MEVNGILMVHQHFREGTGGHQLGRVCSLHTHLIGHLQLLMLQQWINNGVKALQYSSCCGLL